MAVRRIVPNLHAPDPARARAFYADLLGLEAVMDRSCRTPGMGKT